MREDRSVHRRAWELLRTQVNAEFVHGALYTPDMVKGMMPRIMQDCLNQAVQEFREQGREIGTVENLGDVEGETQFHDASEPVPGDTPTDKDDPTKYEETGPEETV